MISTDPNKELEALRAENAALKARMVAKISFKVGEKGGLSVYGLQRFPVTLYKSQWHALAEKMPSILEFIKANEALLVEKAA